MYYFNCANLFVLLIPNRNSAARHGESPRSPGFFWDRNGFQRLRYRASACNPKDYVPSSLMSPRQEKRKEGAKDAKAIVE